MKIIPSILVLIFLLSFSVLAFSESPINWKVYYKMGDSQQSNTFTISNEENITKTISLLVVGDDPNLISLPYSSLTVGPLNSTTLTLTTSIQNASAGLILDYLNLNSGMETDLITIPINITLSSQPPQQQNIGDCSLVPDATDFIQRITKDTTPFTKKFNIRIGSECSDKVKLTNILLQNTIQTSNGEKPISLTGSLNLGDKSPGDTSSFDLLFDVVDVDTGTYNPSVKVIGVYKNTTISTTINFQIQVTKSLVSPNADLNKMPSYIVPETITSGVDFEIVARDLDPNFQPFLLPNSQLIGKSVGIDSSGVWSWKGYTNQTIGTIKISLATLYKGSQIGPVLDKTLKLITASAIPSSPNMTFEFFPPLSQITSGSNTSFVLRDLGNNNIIVGATVYLNGQAFNGTFTVLTGQEYKLSATHPNYNTVDVTIKLNETYVDILLNPSSNIKTNNPLNISSSVKNAVFFVDDTLVSNNLYTPLQEKTYTIKATATGYLTTYMNFSAVMDIYSLTQPDLSEKKKGNLISYKLNTPVQWYATVRDPNNPSITESVSSGYGQDINFTISKAGIYSVTAGNKQIDQFEIKGLFSGLSNFNPFKTTANTIITVAVIIFLIVLFFLFVISRRRSSSGGITMPLGISGDDFSSPLGGME